MDSLTKKIRETVAQIIDSGAHLDIATATEAVAKKLGLSERLINYTHIEFRNKLNESGFKSTPFNKRILFLPHCLKSTTECPAKYNDEGLQCTECGKCQIDELIKLAEEKGYSKTFITPGGSMVIKLIEKYKPKAVLGICCFDEANLAFDKLKGTGIFPQSVLLLRDGCKDTAVNTEEVKEKMFLIELKKEESAAKQN